MSPFFPIAVILIKFAPLSIVTVVENNGDQPLLRIRVDWGGCSVKIAEEQVLHVGLQQKAKEFKESGSEVYAKA